MSQYPPAYGQYPGQPFVEQRTSVLAVLSLVFSLLCCIPGPAVLGVILGVAALIVISGSDGRVVGRGLAIAGIIISLLVSSVWIGVGVGGGYVWSEYQRQAEPLGEKFRALDKGDYATFRTLLTTEANARITDADLDAFRSGYQSELGNVVGVPATPVEYLQIMMESSNAFASAQQTNDVIPFLMTFDKGKAVVFLQLDPAVRTGQSGPGLKYINAMISSPKGSKWTLWGGSPGAPGTPSPDAPKPDAGRPDGVPETPAPPTEPTGAPESSKPPTGD